jgi:hypothetical protein
LPDAGSTNAPTTAAATNVTLNSVSYNEKTRPRKSSSTCSCTSVSTLILEPCATMPSSKAAGSSVCIVYGTPSATSVSAAPANSPVTQACLPNRRTAAGVTAAAVSVPTAVAAKTCPNPASPAWKIPSSVK